MMPYFLLEAKEKYLVKNRIHYVVGDARNLPFKNKSFDFVFCSSVLEHLSQGDILSALKGFERICKGTIQLDVPNENRIIGIARKFLSILGLYKRYAEAQTYELCHHSRFVVNDWKKIGFSVYGCIGWVTRKCFNIHIWNIYDFFVWYLPIFAGTLIAVKKFKK